MSLQYCGIQNIDNDSATKVPISIRCSICRYILLFVESKYNIYVLKIFVFCFYHTTIWAR